MPRNGSGAYSVPNSFSAGQSISSASMNANFSDVGTELANSLPRDGQAGMTGQMKAANGSAATPSLTFGSDTDSGFFRKTADTIGVAVGGVEVGTMSSAGLGGTLQPIPTGTVMLFVQTAAPTGWTKSTAHDNKALRVVAGTAGSGGTSAFTTVFASRTLTVANLPPHTHTATSTVSDPGHAHVFEQRSVGETNLNVGGPGRAGSASTDPRNTFSATTGITVATTIANTGSGQALDFAVQYVDVIIATKD